MKARVYRKRTCTEEEKNAAVSAYYACPEKPVEEIAKEQGMTRSTVYKHKRKLEGMGYNVPEMDSRRKKKHAKAGEQLYEMTLRNALLEKLAELKKARAST